MNEENELDKLFKKRLEDPVDNESYNEADWDGLEQMLDKRKRRRGVVYWLPLYGTVAALLLLFLGYMILRPKIAGNKPGNNSQVVVAKPTLADTSSRLTKQQQRQRQQTNQPINPSKSAVIAKNSADAGNKRHQQLAKSPFAGEARQTASLVKQDTAEQVEARSDELLSKQGTSSVFGDANLGRVYIAVQPVYNVTLTVNKATVTTPEKKANIIKQTNSYRPQLTLSVIAAPDINGVGSFQQSKVGTNEGLLFSVGLSRKFTVSTGTIYSVKPYLTGFENYHTQFQFPTDPINVTADCRMLDIPLNIGYQVFNKHQNSISVGTGLSSYIMLHQSFTFNYASALYTGPAQYTVPKSDGYYFGILNLNATFQHQVNSKVGFTVQPYVKLPLTNIGFSQVRLQTTGVALGLTWNLNQR